MAHYTGYSIDEGKSIVVDDYLKGHASVFEDKVYDNKEHFIGYKNGNVYSPVNALVDLSTMKVLGINIQETSDIIDTCNNRK
jgi:hypothetical protein